jgi:hypothetical protein
MEKSHYKVGIQYSHYCGTELLELCCSINLCLDYMTEDPEEAKRWGNRAQEMVNQLRIKISDLDKLNGMKYE